jgi:ornithine cyclodeaminase
MPDTKIDFLYLSEPDMIKAGVTDMSACVDTMEQVLTLLATGDYRMSGINATAHGAMVNFPATSEFPNMPVDGPDRRFSAMPAYLGGEFNMAGMKWYGSNVANRAKGLPRSIHLFVLNDKETGAPVAVMSANLLSAYRTGAVPGVAARHLSSPDSKELGVIGPGVMNTTALEAFMVARPDIELIKIKGRGNASIAAFQARVAELYPEVKTIAVDTIEEAVSDSDIVSICTSGAAEMPFVDEAWIKPGALITLPADAKFDENFLIHRARKITDANKLYESFAEEYPYPTHPQLGLAATQWTDMIHDGKLGWESLTSIGHIITGSEPARQHPDQVVLMSIGGMPVEDVAWGKYCYENALAQGIGVSLNLWDTPHMA